MWKVILPVLTAALVLAVELTGGYLKGLIEQAQPPRQVLVTVQAAADLPAVADGYTKWVTDPVQKTHTCHYAYLNTTGTVSDQTVVVFYGDQNRRRWAYFYNARKEPWARCAVPVNPRFKAGVPVWEELTCDGAGYAPLRGAARPTPKDGTKPVADLPLPPA